MSNDVKDFCPCPCPWASSVGCENFENMECGIYSYLNAIYHERLADISSSGVEQGSENFTDDSVPF